MSNFLSTRRRWLVRSVAISKLLLVNPANSVAGDRFLSAALRKRAFARQSPRPAGTPLYRLYRYVRPLLVWNWVWILAAWVWNWVRFSTIKICVWNWVCSWANVNFCYYSTLDIGYGNLVQLWNRQANFTYLCPKLGKGFKKHVVHTQTNFSGVPVRPADQLLHWGRRGGEANWNM